MRRAAILFTHVVCLLLAHAVWAGAGANPPSAAQRHANARQRLMHFLSSSEKATAMEPQHRNERLHRLASDLQVEPFVVKDPKTQRNLGTLRLDAALLLETAVHREGKAYPSVVLASRFGAKLLLQRAPQQYAMQLKLETPTGGVLQMAPNYFELFGIHRLGDLQHLLGEAMDSIAPEDLD